NNNRWRSTTGRVSLKDLKTLRVKEAENKLARREMIEQLLEEKNDSAQKDAGSDALAVTTKTTRLRTTFVEQLRPLAMDMRLLRSDTATDSGGSGGSGVGASPSLPKEKDSVSLEDSASTAQDAVDLEAMQSSQQFVERAFSKTIRDDVLNTLVTGLVRRSHIMLYAEDPWSEGYSLPLLEEVGTQTGAHLTALDIPDWSVLTSRIDPILEDLTIVSHPYSPPPDLDTSEHGEGGRGMAFFSGINRKQQHDEGDLMSEQIDGGSEEPAHNKDGEDVDDEDSVNGRPLDIGVDSIRAHFGIGKGSGAGGAAGDRLGAADEEGGDPVLSREMMSNPLSRSATERLDRVLGDFVSLPAVVDGIQRPRIIAIKHMGDLLNTRVGYTLFSRLIAAVSRHNSSEGAVPVVVVGLLHPSWFHPDMPPPGIPPFDINPSTPVALMPTDDRSEALNRGVNGIVEGLLGEEGQRAAGGRLGVHVVQMDGLPANNRISRTLGASPGMLFGGGKAAEELPLFARIGIPPAAHTVVSAMCDMQSPEYAQQTDSTSAQQMVGSLRQSLIAEQCLDRNARVIRNICLLYQVPGLELSDQEAAHLETLSKTGGSKVFLRETLYNEPVGLPKQPKRNTWNLDYRPFTVMLRSLPDDVGRRFFFGETFLHRWISLAQALAVREKLSLEAIRADPSVLVTAARDGLLGSRHLVQAWMQLLESYVALRHGVIAYRSGKKAADKPLVAAEVESENGILPLHRQVDFAEIGIGRKAEDDMDPKTDVTKDESHLELLDHECDVAAPSAEKDEHTQWSSVSRELEGDGEDASGGDDAGSGRGAKAPVPAQKRIQLAKKNLTEYEQRLVGSVVDPQSIPTGFGQVCVKPETVTTLQEIITLPMLRPEYFSKGVLRRYNVSGILLFGPPGTGKTMLAKAVAKESGSVVLNIRASDIYDKYVGEGEKLAEAVFTLARKLAPCVIFIDEVDALFSARSSGETNKFRRDIMNQIMSEWDGINTQRKKGATTGAQGSAGPPPQVMVMAATNRPFDLDDAILRRLPRRIMIDLPGVDDRKQILRIHLAGEELDADIDMEALAKRTDNFSGSDLKNLCVAAALAALRERVQEEVGGAQSATEGVSLIERLRGTRKPAAAAAMLASPTSVSAPASASASASTAASAAGSSHRAKSIKLATRHFDAALKK
ncbi:hypothetical protein GGF37_003358, partial [Kickxella alabastrina]